MHIVQRMTGRARANATLFTVLCMTTLASVIIAWASVGQAGGFGPAAPLAMGRGFHTATLLPSGKVLVTGGVTSTNNVRASAELYDPASDTWSAAGSMGTGRVRHTATLLPSGKVLVVGGGGADFVPLASAEFYDPASNTWGAAGSVTTARTDHTATLLLSGNVLVAGGYGAVNAELYDPASNMWSVVTSMGTGRSGHTATLLPSGTVLVAGGFGTIGPVAGAEFYDPASNTWSAAGSMAIGREFHTATLLPSGQVLMAGGFTLFDFRVTASAELYDPASNAWSAAGTMTLGSGYHTATLLPSGQVLVTGGQSGHDAHFAPSVYTDALLYDPASPRWSATGSMAIGRGIHTATLLHSGKVLVAGGGNDQTGLYLASAELYDPNSGGAPPKALAVEYYHTAFDHYFITANGDEIAKLDTGVFIGWARTGQTFNVHVQVGSATSSVCRFFSASFAPKSSHFYTPDLAECLTRKTDPNWQFEGVRFYAPRPDATATCFAGTQPIYRLYNNGQGGAPNHRYTTSLDIRSQMLAQGWIPEGDGTIGVIMCAPL